MIANKSKGTKIELLLGKMMWNAGIRYRKNDSSLPGTPDFSIRSAFVAVFCDGEFWHGHNWDERKKDIKTNRDFWYAKINRNIKRDERVNEQLEAMGWKVFRFWENDIRREPELCMRKVLDYVHAVNNDRTSPSATYGNACNQLNLYGPHSYNRDGSIMSVSDQMAVVSHYVHNYGHRYAEPFENEGEGLVQDICCNDEYTVLSEDEARSSLFKNTLQSPFPPPKHTEFTFVDLFAGIGGMRLALQKLGGRCIFASDWDNIAAKEYFTNFGEAPFGDITKEETKTYLPHDIDILCASLPLQAFALEHKRNLTDKIKGTLFAETAEVIRRREPLAVIIECPGLQINYKAGTALGIMTDVITKELGYFIPEAKLLDTLDFGLAHTRKYLYLIAFKNETDALSFSYPLPTDNSRTFKDVIEDNTVSARYYITRKAATKSESLKLYDIEDKITLRYDSLIKDARTTDIMPCTRKLDRINREGIRRITPREYARLQGFPDDYRINVDDSAARRMFLSSTPVNVVLEVARRAKDCLKLKKRSFRYGR